MTLKTILAFLLFAPVMAGAYCPLPCAHYEPSTRTEYRVCPICGHCQPENVSESISCTLLGCRDGCCNTCDNYFRCLTTDSNVCIAIGECDNLVWCRWVREGQVIGVIRGIPIRYHLDCKVASGDAVKVVGEAECDSALVRVGK